jgi:hypothetical protein
VVDETIYYLAKLFDEENNSGTVELKAINLNDGEELWSIEIDSIDRDDVYVFNILKHRDYIVLANVGVYSAPVICVNIDSQRIQWSRNDLSIVQLAATENGLYALEDNTRIIELNPENGDIIYTNSITEEEQSFFVKPAIHNGTVYTVGGGNIYTISLDSFTTKNNLEFESSNVNEYKYYNSLTVIDDEIIISYEDNPTSENKQTQLWGVEKQTGDVFWSWELDQYLTTNPSVADRTVYYGTVDEDGKNGRIEARSYNGDLDWAYETGPVEDVIVAGSVVYAEVWTGLSRWDSEFLEKVSEGAEVIALDRDTGNRLWSRATTSFSYGEMVPADGALIVEDPSTGVITFGRSNSNGADGQSESGQQTSSGGTRDDATGFLKRVTRYLLSTEAILIQGAAVLAFVIWYGWPEENDKPEENNNDR